MTEQLVTVSCFITLAVRFLSDCLVVYDKDASDTELTCTTRLSKNERTNLKEHLPPLVSSTNPYHRRRPLQRQVPKHKTETYRQSLSPSKTTLWNDLPENIQRQNQLVKLNSFSPEMTNPPPFFYNGSRKTQIIHCKLRLGMSNLIMINIH